MRISGDGTELAPDADVVINRLLLSNVYRLLENLGLANAFDAFRPKMNSPRTVLTALHTFATAARLSETGVPTPEPYLGLTGPQLEEGEISSTDPGEG